MGLKNKLLIILAFIISLSFSVNSFAITIDRQLMIQPIYITDNNSNAFFDINNSELAAVEASLDTIWEQAGIDIDFLNTTKYKSPLDGYLDESDLYDQYSWWTGELIEPAPFWPNAESDPSASSDPNVINMWLTNTIDLVGNSIAGITKDIAGDSFIIAENYEHLSYIIAHEIGHVLGLFHDFDDQRNLMYPSITRFSEGFLTNNQVNDSRTSGFLIDYNPVPEPATMMLFGIGLLGLAKVYRKKKF